MMSDDTAHTTLGELAATTPCRHCRQHRDA